MTFLDNIGIVLAGIFRAPSQGVTTVFGLKAIDASIFTTTTYNTSNFTSLFNITELKVAQVGKGTSPVTRQDFDIENVFPDSPESSRVGSLNDAYNSGLGKITMATLISPTGGAGSITEVCKFVIFRAPINPQDRICCILRDVISPVGFIIGESINIDHEVLI